MAGTALLGFWSSGGEYGGTMLQVLVCAYSHGPGRRQSPAFVAARAGSKRALTRITLRGPKLTFATAPYAKE